MATREIGASLANYSREFSEASHIFSKMVFGECWQVWRVLAKRLGECHKFGESAQHGLANVGESGKSAQHGLANVGEYSPSLLANVGGSTHDRIGRFKHK
jgi:hypothetical protein